MNLRKMIKKVQKREALKMSSKLDQLSAAFMEETGLKASECVLVGKDEKDGRKYWFEKRVDRISQSEMHPDMQQVFKFAYRTLFGPQLDDEENAAFREMMERYKEGADRDAENKSVDGAQPDGDSTKTE